MPFKPPAGQTI